MVRSDRVFPRSGKSARPGFSLVELVIVLGLISLAYSLVVLTIKPEELKKKSRDLTRLSDISRLVAAVEAYISDYGAPPDSANLTRLSTISVGSGPAANSHGQGWIGADLSKYLENLPLDPLNNAAYFYRYRTDGVKYEIDAKLEFYTDEMTKDGGNDPGRYERGTDLNIL